MDKIVPRWEWRTFGSGFGEGEETVGRNLSGGVVESRDVYVVSAASGANVKIRDATLDVKILGEVNVDRLERWEPVWKADFPLSAAETVRALSILGAAGAAEAEGEYPPERFMKEIVGPSEPLRAVHVSKKRRRGVFRGALVEIADLAVNGAAARTVCVEHDDPALVASVVRELRFDRFENISYIRAFKNIFGVECS